MAGIWTDIGRNGFLTNRFFICFGIITGLCAGGFIFSFFFTAAMWMIPILGVITLADAWFVSKSAGRLRVERDIAAVLPLGDPSEVAIRIESRFPYRLKASLIDEWPHQFQQRDFLVDIDLGSRESRRIVYTIRPLHRGVYRFGRANLFTKSAAGLFQLRHVFEIAQDVAVYPSVIQMKRHELTAVRNVLRFPGIKRIRRLGHSYEFEQIKNYVSGDDHRSVNWKATGRKGELMVNQYGDERSQQVYSIIDKSRVMRLPFNGLSLMDHAVNTALAISNIALLKHDKAGLVTFADKIGSIIKADNRPNQLKRIIGTLYRESESENEADYQLLYTISRRLIRHRSLVILFSNFESEHALERVVPQLRRINYQHLLLVVFFENSEVAEYAGVDASDTLEICMRTMAGKFRLDKKIMAKRLEQFGIQTILTRPEDLSVNTVNKYLEFKARGFI